MWKLLVVLLGLMAVTLWGCDQAIVETEQVELPNPASEYCLDQGGQLEIRTDSEGGQYGVCVFADGSECEEWSFYRNECRPGEEYPESESTAAELYVNEDYGFSLDPAGGWVVDDQGDYVTFTRPGYTFFLGYQWADEELKPFRTGMPQGELIDGGTSTLLGQPIQRSFLVWEDRIKVIDYGGRTKVGDLILVMYLDAVGSGDQTYDDLDLTDEMISDGDRLIASFKLVSGETPQIESVR